MGSSVYGLLPGLAKAVRADHAGMEEGHGFDSHVYRVAALALRFGEELGVGALAAAAGLCHNADRLLHHQGREVTKESVTALVQEWLKNAELSEADKAKVVQAVLRHGRPNEDDDDPVTIALKDADRVAGLALDAMIRIGQFHASHPVIDMKLLLEDRRGSHVDRPTVAADVLDNLEWAEPGPFQVRTEGARKMAGPRAERLRKFLEDWAAQLQEEDIFPFPF